ncbi:hypothetical protein GCM10020000_61260 [Streptomyces olivoverticillatus]
MLNGFTRYAIAPASRARSTRSRCEKAVSIRTGGDRIGRDPLRGGDPVEHRHLHIEDDQVRLVLPRQRHGRLAVARLAHDGVALFFEHLLEVEPDQGLVLGDHDTGGVRRGVLRLVVDGRLGLGGGHGTPL